MNLAFGCLWRSFISSEGYSVSEHYIKYDESGANHQSPQPRRRADAIAMDPGDVASHFIFIRGFRELWRGSVSTTSAGEGMRWDFRMLPTGNFHHAADPALMSTSSPMSWRRKRNRPQGRPVRPTHVNLYSGCIVSNWEVDFRLARDP